MQTRLRQPDTPQGQRADAILRRCVHCGFCNATCPTFQLLGDELDGPRGRIYQIKAMLEGESNLDGTRLHLDRCLTCRACETTCPSGVKYSELVEIGREQLAIRLPRPRWQRLQRWALLAIVPVRKRFAAWVRLANPFNPLLPDRFRVPAPDPAGTSNWPTNTHAQEVLLLEGCVQAVLSPGIDRHLAYLLDHIGIRLRPVKQSGCCGAVPHHLDAPDSARQMARTNLDALLPELGPKSLGILISASACELELREYPQLLTEDPLYREKAQQLAERVLDPAALIAEHLVSDFEARFPGARVALHEPCTLQHGLQRGGALAPLLETLGYAVTPVRDGHLCCGSAGTYSLFQPELSQKLRGDKLENLLADAPDYIVTANIGCLHHLRAASPVPVRHWLELLQTKARV